MDLAFILSALFFLMTRWIKRMASHEAYVRSYTHLLRSFIYPTSYEDGIGSQEIPLLFPLSQGKVSGRLVIRCKLGEGGIPVGDASRLIHQRPPPSHS